VGIKQKAQEMVKGEKLRGGYEGGVVGHWKGRYDHPWKSFSTFKKEKRGGGGNLLEYTLDGDLFSKKPHGG